MIFRIVISVSAITDIKSDDDEADLLVVKTSHYHRQVLVTIIDKF
jgi:hypothetical protein